MRHRRLVGPTILSIALCALVADHLFLSQSPQSVSRLLGGFVGVFSTILAPPSSPSFYTWMGDGLLPLALAVLALLLLWLMFARAKQAMSQAAPKVVVAESVKVRKVEQASPVVVLDESDAVRPVDWQHRLVAKLGYTIAAVAGLIVVVACAIVYVFLISAVERQAHDRASVMAWGLHDVVAQALPTGRADKLAAAVDNYVSRNNIIYVYVEDADGRMIAHWPQDLPRYLSRDFPRTSERALGGVDGAYRGVSIYDIARRIENGQSGFVHVAVSRDAITREARQVLAIMAGVILLALFCIAGGFLWMTRPLFGSWMDLVAHAEKISKGDFTVPLALQRTDEIGDISRSLERMRSSLRAVAARLEQGQITRRSNE